MQKYLTESENLDYNNMMIFNLANEYKANSKSFLNSYDYFPFYIYLNCTSTYNYLHYNVHVSNALSSIFDSDLKQNTIHKIKSISNIQVFNHADRFIQQFYGNKDFSQICSSFQNIKVYGKMYWVITHKAFVSNNDCINLAYKLVDFGAVGEKLSRILSPLIDDINSWKRFQTLSKREKEILKLIAQGHNNKNIGSMLYISENTVRTHRDQIMKKIEARNFNEMISFADAFDLIGAL